MTTITNIQNILIDSRTSYIATELTPLDPVPYRKQPITKEIKKQPH